MMRISRAVLSIAVAVVLLPMSSFAGVGVPELDPGSAVSGLAMVMTTAALILERRRRR